MSFNSSNLIQYTNKRSAQLLERINIAAKAQLANCIDFQNQSSIDIYNHLISYLKYYIQDNEGTLQLKSNKDQIPDMINGTYQEIDGQDFQYIAEQSGVVSDQDQDVFDYDMFDSNTQSRFKQYMNDFYQSINDYVTQQANKIVQEELSYESSANKNMG